MGVALFCGVAWWAEACCIEPASAEADTSKRNLAKRFTAILLSEIPYNAIESQVAEKVSGIWDANGTGNQQAESLRAA